MSDLPSISVIIPTRGRDQCLRDTLKDLSVQTYSNFDVWVVDQNDKPLENLETNLTPKKLIHEKMPPKGSHAGRNHAIFKTGNELCVFIDDDVRVDKNFLEHHSKAYRDSINEGFSVVAGKVFQPKDGLSEEQMIALGRPAKYSSVTGIVTGNFIGSQKSRVDHIHECNFSAPTKALIAVHGFNEEFKGNAYFEGTDLALKLIKAGYKIIYRPDLVVTHLQDGAGGNREKNKAKHTYWYARNYSLLNSVHMRKWSVPFFETYLFLYVLAKAFKNRDPNIAYEGLKGIKDGSTFFWKIH